MHQVSMCSNEPASSLPRQLVQSIPIPIQRPSPLPAPAPAQPASQPKPAQAPNPELNLQWSSVLALFCLAPFPSSIFPLLHSLLPLLPQSPPPSSPRKANHSPLPPGGPPADGWPLPSLSPPSTTRLPHTRATLPHPESIPMSPTQNLTDSAARYAASMRAMPFPPYAPGPGPHGHPSIHPYLLCARRPVPLSCSPDHPRPYSSLSLRRLQSLVSIFHLLLHLTTLPYPTLPYHLSPSAVCVSVSLRPVPTPIFSQKSPAPPEPTSTQSLTSACVRPVFCPHTATFDRDLDLFDLLPILPTLPYPTTQTTSSIVAADH